MTPLELQLKELNNMVGYKNLSDGYNCGICKNKGVVYVPINEMICQQDCKCKKIRDVIRKTNNSGLAEDFHELTFDNYNTSEPWQEEFKKTAIDFCNDDSANWFFAGGQSGSGKTHLCTAIFTNMINTAEGMAKYTSWVDESKKIKQFANDSRYQQLIDELKNAQVLYIDDFLKTGGNSIPTDGDIKLAFEIINSRISRRNCTTIISSEYTLNELVEFDEATIGRIFQATGKYKVNILKNRNRNYRLRA